MSETFEVTCLCGGVVLQLAGPTEFASHCHCASCRAAHAAPLVTWTSVPDARFRVARGAEHVRPFESSPGVVRSFCAVCGTSLIYTAEEVPGRTYVPAALLGDRLDRPVEGHVCYDEHLPWIDDLAAMPCFRGLSEQERMSPAWIGREDLVVPLGLMDEWPWDPTAEHWIDEAEPPDAWQIAILERGVRPAYEMEVVSPGWDPAVRDSHPIFRAVELREAGDPAGARAVLTRALAADQRCLDAHAHLGSWTFDDAPLQALRHFEQGVRIGDFSLGEGFDGVLPWACLANRPYLRCLHGYGLCLWRLGRLHEALVVFERMLWLDPVDAQGVRFLVDDVRGGVDWSTRYG